MNAVASRTSACSPDLAPAYRRAVRVSTAKLNGTERAVFIVTGIIPSAKGDSTLTRATEVIVKKYAWFRFAFVYPEKRHEDILKRCTAEASGLDPNIDQAAIAMRKQELAQLAIDRDPHQWYVKWKQGARGFSRGTPISA